MKKLFLFFVFLLIVSNGWSQPWTNGIGPESIYGQRFKTNGNSSSALLYLGTLSATQISNVAGALPPLIQFVQSTTFTNSTTNFGGIFQGEVQTNGDYTVTWTNTAIVETASTNTTINLPYILGPPSVGQLLYILNYGSGINTLNAGSTNAIGTTNSTYVVSPGNGLSLLSLAGGTNWMILSSIASSGGGGTFSQTFTTNTWQSKTNFANYNITTNISSASNLTAQSILVLPDGSTMTNAANAVGLTNFTISLSINGTNYAQSLTNGFVTAAVTNGLATTSYVGIQITAATNFPVGLRSDSGKFTNTVIAGTISSTTADTAMLNAGTSIHTNVATFQQGVNVTGGGTTNNSTGFWGNGAGLTNITGASAGQTLTTNLWQSQTNFAFSSVSTNIFLAGEALPESVAFLELGTNTTLSAIANALGVTITPNAFQMAIDGSGNLTIINGATVTNFNNIGTNNANYSFTTNVSSSAIVDAVTNNVGWLNTTNMIQAAGGLNTSQGVTNGYSQVTNLIAINSAQFQAGATMASTMAIATGVFTNSAQFLAGMTMAGTASISAATVTNTLGAATGDFVTLNAGTSIHTNVATFQQGINVTGGGTTNNLVGFWGNGAGLTNITGASAGQTLTTNLWQSQTNFANYAFTTNLSSAGTGDFATLNAGGATITNTLGTTTVDANTLNSGNHINTNNFQQLGNSFFNGNLFGTNSSFSNSTNVGGIYGHIISTNGNYTLLSTDFSIAEIATTNSTLTLPYIVGGGIAGQILQIANFGTALATVQAGTSNSIGNGTTSTNLPIAAGQSYILQSIPGGTNWSVMSGEVTNFVVSTFGTLTVTNIASAGTVDGNTINAGSLTVTNTFNAATVDAVNLNAGTINATNSAQFQAGMTAAGTSYFATADYTNSVWFQSGFTSAGSSDVATFIATNAAEFIGGAWTPQGMTNSYSYTTNTSTVGTLSATTSDAVTVNGGSATITNTISAATGDFVTLNGGSGTLTNTFGIGTADANTLNSGAHINTNNFQQLGNSFFNGNLFGTNVSFNTATNVGGFYGKIISTNGHYTLLSTDYSIVEIATTNSTLTLPYIVGGGTAGQIIQIANFGTAISTVQAGTSNSIGNGVTLTNLIIAAGQSYILQALPGGTNWAAMSGEVTNLVAAAFGGITVTNVAGIGTADANTLNAGSATVTNAISAATTDAVTLNSGAHVNTNNFQQLGNSFFNGNLFGTNTSLSTLTNQGGAYNKLVSTNGNYSILSTDNAVVEVASTNTVINLPYIPGGGSAGQVISLVNLGSGTANLQAGISNSIGDSGTSTNLSVAANSAYVFQSTPGGTNWLELASPSSGSGSSSSNYVTLGIGSIYNTNSITTSTIVESGGIQDSSSLGVGFNTTYGTGGSFSFYNNAPVVRGDTIYYQDHSGNPMFTFTLGNSECASTTFTFDYAPTMKTVTAGTHNVSVSTWTNFPNSTITLQTNIPVVLPDGSTWYIQAAR